MKTRMGEAWMQADEYGRGLPKFTLNLLVRDVAEAIPFYRDVLQATVRYADADFAAMEIGGTEFMLHADHAYDQHPLHERVQGIVVRGIGAEIVQEARDFPHGWRDVMLADVDGYVWAVGVAIGGK